MARRTLLQMHTTNYTHFVWGKGDLLKKKSEANRGPPLPLLNSTLVKQYRLSIFSRKSFVL